MVILSPRSKGNLVGVCPDLVRVVERAATLVEDFDFLVAEGVRDGGRQARLVEAGKSRTMNSRHLFGFAADLYVLVGGKVSWDIRLYRKLADIMKKAAAIEGVPIQWGGEIWAHAPKPFIDGPHFQLPKCEYPDPS
jgi:peptidoglycan LD-endopeptidase CwlK